MKNLCIVLFISSFLLSQEIVFDSNGNEILLNPNGTWEYISYERDLLFRMTSNELNKTCPSIIDEFTTLTNTIYMDGEFIYNYSVNTNNFVNLGISKDDLNREMYSIMRNSFCTDPDFQIFREYKIKVVWKYYDLKGNYFTKIEVHNNDCF